MSIDIYWSSYYSKDTTLYNTEENIAKGNAIELASISPTPLIKEFSQSDVIPRNLKESYLRCPAAISMLKNIFVVKSPVDFVVDYERNFDRFIGKVNFHHTHDFVARTCESYTFFSEKPINMEVYPAFLHKNEFTDKAVPLPGMFDISKWFRSVDAEFYSRQREIINVKREDALLYIKFNTDENVLLKHFDYDAKIIQIRSNCESLKQKIPGLKLKKMYEMFMSKKYNKRLIKQIKQNLTGA